MGGERSERTTLRRVDVPKAIKPLLSTVGSLAQHLSMSAFAVGGCVRDWLLGIETIVDLDVTVEGNGVDVAQAVRKAVGGTLLIYQQFGTATVQFGSPTAGDISVRAAAPQLPQGGGASAAWRIDFATCRTETYTKPAAYPKVTPGTIEEDLFRRDFTINAMAVSLIPSSFDILIDPFNGVGDLRAKRLRVLHPRSFLDDPSRILRGVRFTQRFALRWEDATQRAAEAALAEGALQWLNAGRLARELARVDREPDPLACRRQLERLLRRAGVSIQMLSIPQRSHATDKRRSG